MAAKVAKAFDPSAARDNGSTPLPEPESVSKLKSKLDSMEGAALRIQNSGMLLGNAVRSIRKSLFPKLIIVSILAGVLGGCTTVVPDTGRLDRLENRVSALEARK